MARFHVQASREVAQPCPLRAIRNRFTFSNSMMKTWFACLAQRPTACPAQGRLADANIQEGDTRVAENLPVAQHGPSGRPLRPSCLPTIDGPLIPLQPRIAGPTGSMRRGICRKASLWCIHQGGLQCTTWFTHFAQQSRPRNNRHASKLRIAIVRPIFDEFHSENSSTWHLLHRANGNFA